jgi:sugar phosphate permease
MGPDGMRKTLRYRHVIFSVLGLGYIIVFFHRLCPAVLAVDMMEDLHAGGTLIGILGSAYFYPYALMQLPAGLLSDSWGARKSAAIFLSIAFIGSILLGAAPSVFWAIAGRALVGLGVSMLFVPAMKVLSEWYNAQEFAVMSGFFMAIGGVGSLASAGPLAWMSAHIGWRLSFISVGILTLGIVLLVALLVRDRPADLGWPSPVQHDGAVPQRIGLMEGVGKVLSDFSFWPLAAWFFFNTVIFFALGGLWGGPYLMQAYHVSKATAGNILSMISIGIIIGSPGLSFLSNRIFKARKPLLIMASIMLAIIAAAMALFTARVPQFVLYLLFLGIGIFSGGVVAVGFTMAKELFPVQIAGTSIGLINLFPFVGGALFQPFIGYVLEQSGRINGAFTVSGYHRAMLVFLLCNLLAFFSSLFIKETVKKQLTVDR